METIKMLNKLIVLPEPLFMLEALTHPATIQDLGSIYTYCNRAFFNRINKEASQVLGRTPGEIFFSEEAMAHAEASKLMSLLQTKRFEYEIGCAESATCTLGRTKVSKMLIETPNLMPIGFLSVFSNKTCQHPKSLRATFNLTDREACVLNSLNKGMSVKLIARSLGASTHTIAGHMKSIYIKMNVTTRSEAQYKSLVALGQL